jgi:hypothetical protein
MSTPQAPPPAMGPCESNCVYGDKDFGNDPFAYDGTKCG